MTDFSVKIELFSSSPFTAGQFFDRTVTIAPYSGPLDLNSNYHSVTVPGRGGEPERERVLCQVVPSGLVPPRETLSVCL